MSLSAKDIFEAKDVKIQGPIPVPEWGGDVYIRVMSVGERDAHEIEWLRNKDKGVTNFRTKFLVKVLCDIEGERLFKDADTDRLKKKSGDVMSRLFDVAMKYNAVAQDDVEEMAGN